MKILATISDKKKHDPIIGVRVLIVSQVLKRIFQWQYTTEWFSEVNLLKPLSTGNELISAILCSRSLVWILRIRGSSEFFSEHSPSISSGNKPNGPYLYYSSR